VRDFAVSDSPAVQRQLDRLAALSLPQGRLGLGPVRELLGRLGNPHRAMPPVFHIAGTNGKGSTSAFLTAMLRADGMRVHQFTSPHLVRYNERIRLANDLIGDDMLAALLREVLDAGEDIGASFFEITTVAAFLGFARVSADACVIEVGLGGRFDATNVIDRPAICGIASLGLDHERFLLAEEDGAPSHPMARIAFEKAGIVKPGVPVVTQRYGPEAQGEIERAARVCGSPLHMRGGDWDVSAGIALEYRDEHGGLTLPLPALPGAFQVENAALALAMLRHQDRVTVSERAAAHGIISARWPARLQWLPDGPVSALAPGARVLLDGGHNPDAGRVLADYLAELDGPVHAVGAMLAAKDAAGFLAPFASYLASFTAVPLPGHDAIDSTDLARIAADAGVPDTRTAKSVEHALAQLGAAGTVLICGSLYLAGEVLRANGPIPD